MRLYETQCMHAKCRVAAKASYTLLAIALFAVSGEPRDVRARDAANAPVTATAEQKAVEDEVLGILATDAMREQIAASEAIWRASPLAQTRDGQRTLREGVMELAGTVTFIAAVSEPSYPRLTWWGAAPRRWMGRRVPGTRWAVDNVDNFYRIATVDGASSYVIHMRPTGPEADQISITLYDNFVGENNTKLDETLGAYLVDDTTQRADDGSITITLGPDPANRRPNHLQTAARSRQLLIRETLGDWSRKSPMAVTIERIGGPLPETRATPEDLTRRAIGLLAAGTDTVLNFDKRFSAFPENAFSRLNIRAREGKDDQMLAPPSGDGGRIVGPEDAWGFVAVGRFNIPDDQALLVTVNPLGVKFLNFMLTTPWMVSLEHVHASGSLNNHQAKPDADGSYTFVVSARDPGVLNWLDTSGLRHGRMVIRWQDLSRPVEASSAHAIPHVERISFSELEGRLGPAVRRVSPDGRRQLLAQRAASYARRCAGEPCEVGNHLGFTPWDP